MFAIPEYTVLRTPAPHPLSPTALVRWVSSSPSWRELLSDAAQPRPVPYDDPRVQIWLSVWPPGTVAPWHRYDASQGAFAVLSGVVVEHAGGTARTLRPGQMRVFGPGYRHTVRSAGPEPAVTVHVQIDGISRANGAP